MGNSKTLQQLLVSITFVGLLFMVSPCLAQTYFSDSFEYENSVINHGWEFYPFGDEASVYTTSDRAYHGNRSLYMDSEDDDEQRIRHNFASPLTNVIVEVYMYDDISQNMGYNTLTIWGPTFGASIGFRSYTSTTHYSTETGTEYSWAATAIPRTSDWQKFSFEVTPEGLKYFINDQLVRTSNHITEIHAVYLMCGDHPKYQPHLGSVYFDNLKVRSINQAPVAVCQNLVKSANENCEATVAPEEVDNGSYDPDGNPLTFILEPSGPFPLGETAVTLLVDDGSESSSCEAIITVEDNTQPVITATENPLVLWPPNHKYQTVDASDFIVSVFDNCTNIGLDDVVITRVTSDEPENIPGGGDGNTEEDIIIAPNCQSVALRVERQGGGNGRVYTLHFSVDDGNGNEHTIASQVHVPHNQNTPATDNGVAYEVISTCGNGIGKYAAKSEVNHITPDGFKLYPNYPNPFNPTTLIGFSLSEPTTIMMGIYNVKGQLIRTLASGQFSSGYHSVLWNATDNNECQVVNGLYFVKLMSGHYSTTGKLLFIK